MKKKTVVLLLLVALEIAVGTYCWFRLSSRGTDIISVTTLL